MFSLFFLDIDDCLIETSRLGKKEIEILQSALNKFKIPHYKEITQEFVASFHRVYNHHQGKKLSTLNEKLRLDYMKRLAQLESPIIKKWGQIKKWSREVFIFVAAQKYSITLTNTKLMEITQLLWETIARLTPFYPDSLKFLQKLLTQKIPFYLITSSDCRLQFNERKKIFTYNPLYSKNLKLKRLQKFLALGIPKENIFIGDPYDKPDVRLFQSALTKAKKDYSLQGNTTFKGVTTVMVGDSLTNDLLPARQAGISQLFWLKRQSTQAKVLKKDGITVINSLFHFASCRV